MRPLRFALFAPVLLLAGCFASEDPLFETSAGRQPLAAGKYEAYVGRYQLEKAGTDHYMLVSGESDSTPSTLTLVPSDGGLYVAQRTTPDSTGYALVRVTKAGFDLIEPDCANEEDRAAAKPFAIDIDDDSCTFEEPQAVAKALAALAAAAPGRWVAYERK